MKSAKAVRAAIIAARINVLNVLAWWRKRFFAGENRAGRAAWGAALIMLVALPGLATAGDRLVAVGAHLAEERGIFLRSDDGGNQFSLITSPDPGTFFGVLGTKQGTLPAFGVAGERSVDHGQTCSPAGLSAKADLTAGIVLKSGHILIVSEDGAVYESADDGLTFRGVSLNEGMALYGLVPNADLLKGR